MTALRKPGRSGGSHKSVREFMEAHLNRANELMAISADFRQYQPMQILRIGGTPNLRCVTTTGLESPRNRRYYLTPCRTAPGGWQILEIYVECAVCKGGRFLDEGTLCSYCGGMAWLKVPSIEDLKRKQQQSPNAARAEAKVR